MDSSNYIKKSVSSLNGWVELDKPEIKKEIQKNGIYTNKEVTIKPWEGEEDTEYYIGSIEKNNFSYNGVLSHNFRRQNYGINYYDNGDFYFGYYDDDYRSKHGAYFWNPTTQNGTIYQQVYHGLWKDNMKGNIGTYLWINETQKKSNFDDANFDCYVGEFQNENFKRGCYLSKNRDNYNVYYGNFNSQGLKHDNKAFFYSSRDDRLIIGKMEKDILVNGFFVTYNDDGKIVDVTFVEFDENENVVKLQRKNQISETQLNQITKDAETFRMISLAEDYFGQIYQNYKKLSLFINKELNDFNIFDDQEGYPKVMKMGACYTDISIFRELEKSI